jgi:hypothetical protein
MISRVSSVSLLDAFRLSVSLYSSLMVLLQQHHIIAVQTIEAIGDQYDGDSLL